MYRRPRALADAAPLTPPRGAPPAAVSVWSVPLGGPAALERALLALLDPHETDRAARFRGGDERRRFVVSHGVLRLVLAACTGRDARAIGFATRWRGKPYVAGPAPHFSLSRGADVALVAVSWGGPVGVDVEPIRPGVGLEAFAGDLITRAAVARIEALPRDRRARAWFQAWTRVEAVAKASGAGLPAVAARRPPGTGPWRTWDLDLDAGYVGAVAAAPGAGPLVYHALPDVAAVYARFAA